MHLVYILCSRSRNKYYVGETDDVDRRLLLNNNGHFKGAFTSQTGDWQVSLIIECRDRSHSLLIEKAVKGRKNRNYIKNLIKYPELVERLVLRF